MSIHRELFESVITTITRYFGRSERLKYEELAQMMGIAAQTFLAFLQGNNLSGKSFSAACKHVCLNPERFRDPESEASIFTMDEADLIEALRARYLATCLGFNVKAVREACEHTPEEMAGFGSIHQRSYEALERNGKIPSGIADIDAFIAALVAATGCREDFLRTGEMPILKVEERPVSRAPDEHPPDPIHTVLAFNAAQVQSSLLAIQDHWKLTVKAHFARFLGISISTLNPLLKGTATTLTWRTLQQIACNAAVTPDSVLSGTPSFRLPANASISDRVESWVKWYGVMQMHSITAQEVKKLRRLVRNDPSFSPPTIIAKIRDTISLRKSE